MRTVGSRGRDFGQMLGEAVSQAFRPALDAGGVEHDLAHGGIGQPFASSRAVSAAWSSPAPMNTNSCRRSPQGSCQCRITSAIASGWPGQRSFGTLAHHRPNGLTVDSAPARLNSATQSGRVAIQKCPLARITPGRSPFNTSCTRTGSNGARAR